MFWIKANKTIITSEAIQEHVNHFPYFTKL